MKKWTVLVAAMLVLGTGAAGWSAGADAADEPGESNWRKEPLLGLPVEWRNPNQDDPWLRSFYWGLEQRFRAEWRNGMGFNYDVEDEFLLSRTRLWLGGELGKRLDFHIEGRHAQSWFDDFLPHDHPVFEDQFDLFQGYVTAKLTDKLKLRVGREMLNFDDQRLVGGLLWTNTSRSFDTIHAIYENDRIRLDVGAARVVIIRPNRHNSQNHNDDFYYLHLTAKQTGIEQMKASVFGYFRSTTIPDVFRREQYTVGGRVWGKVPDTPFDYDFTAAFQFGDVDFDATGNANILAHALHGEVGYTFADCRWKPRWSVEANWASGDDNPGGGRVRTFDQMYPTNHLKYGIADMVGWKNQRNVGTHLKMNPTDKLNVWLSYFAFWTDSSNDALYGAGGGPIVTNAESGRSNFIGHEVDAQMTYKIKPGLALSGGMGYFFADDYIKNNTAKGEDFLFGFLQMVINLN